MRLASRNRLLPIRVLLSAAILFFATSTFQTLMDTKWLETLAQIPRSENSIRVLTANVGNLNPSCGGIYNYKLCERDVEERIGRSIAALRPDIVALQEVLNPVQCRSIREANPNRVCFERGPDYEQARYLLGPDFSIVCEGRSGFECTGVRLGFGEIEGCAPGELCRGIGRSDVAYAECDQGFTVFSVTVKAQGVRFGVINAHPQSTDAQCRSSAIRQIFETVGGEPPLASEAFNLILGDFNLDPLRDDDESTSTWQKYVGQQGDGLPYYYLSGLSEHNPPYLTSFYVLKRRTVDHIVTNFGRGVCYTLGEAPGTSRLDGGRGTDHRAVLCDWLVD